MTLPWYPRDLGKYARDTKHLTMLEHGAYNLLLDYYYATGGLPQALLEQGQKNASLLPEHSRIYRLCGAHEKREQEAVDAVISMFFPLDEHGFYRNKKADEVMQEQRLKHEKRVEAGRLGGNAKAKVKQSPSKKTKTKTKNIESPLTPQGDGAPAAQGSSDSVLDGSAPAARGSVFNMEHFLDDDDRQRVRAKAPGWDIYHLCSQFNNFVANQNIVPRSPMAMFMDWIPKYTKGKSL